MTLLCSDGIGLKENVALPERSLFLFLRFLFTSSSVFTATEMAFCKFVAG